MPHAVILDARTLPTFGAAPLAREGGRIHKVVEVAQLAHGLLVKSLIIDGATTTRFLARIDQRDDGIVVRLDDHMHVERTPIVFEHLALLARRVLDANPGARVGQTNLAIPE